MNFEKRTSRLRALLVFLLLFLPPFGYCGETDFRPLIFFSARDNPGSDPELLDRISTELKIARPVCLDYGENQLGGFHLIVLRAPPIGTAPAFSEVYALFEFVVKNSVHRADPLLEFPEYHRQLFYEPGPVHMTCGKISGYFAKMAVSELQFPRKNIRMVQLFDMTEKEMPHHIRKGYIPGQHAVLEMYFQDLQTWVLLDLDKGVIGTRNGRPASAFALNRAMADEINLTPVGLDQYGKGGLSTKAVNAYYKKARNCFGFKQGKKFHALFTPDGPEDISLFTELYKKTYGDEPVLYTSADAFYAAFYAQTPGRAEGKND